MADNQGTVERWRLGARVDEDASFHVTMELSMSRLNSPGYVGRPTSNVYTGLAFIAMVATLVALVYVVLRFMDMGVFR